MTKIALVGDLHGNWPATQAIDQALNDAAPDAVWFLGDAVGKGPENRETCDWARSRCSLFVGGNWDYGIGGKEFPADEYYWDQLGPERMAWLNGLPREQEAWISGIRFRIFHGRPVTELLIGEDSNDKLATALCANGETYGGAIFADSHRPFFRSLRQGYVMNTGSVGNSIGVPRAHCLLVTGSLDSRTPAALEISVLAVPYDNEAAAEAARRDPGLPHRNAYIREVLTGIYSR